MSAIADALKEAKSPTFLVEADFDGLIRRWSTRDVTVEGADGPRRFSASLLEGLSIGSRFDFSGPKVSIGNVSMAIENSGRLQDQEKSRRLDGGTVNVYLWCPGLTWEQIATAGLVFSGGFEKDYHDRHRFVFSAVERSRDRFRVFPERTLSTDAWPDLRTEGGSGSVAGKAAATVFGAWEKGIPLSCVDTSSFVYLAAGHAVSSTESDYNAQTVEVFDKDGAAIAPANFTFSTEMDGRGQVSAIFTFTGDQAANEPLTCAIHGIADGSGEITGAAGTLIEHPAEILHYLFSRYTDLSAGEIDIGSLKTLRQAIPGAKFAGIVNASADGVDVVDRLLSQCQAARCLRAGKMGVMALYSEAPARAVIDCQTRGLGRTARVSRTRADLVANDVEALYGLNPATGQYEGSLVRDRGNHEACEKSRFQYGALPRVTVRFPDVRDEATAAALVDRLLAVRAFRHDLVEIEVPYHLGFDLLEGDAARLSLEEGPGGWDHEKFLLVQRTLNPKIISQAWWRTEVD